MDLDTLAAVLIAGVIIFAGLSVYVSRRGRRQ